MSIVQLDCSIPKNRISHFFFTHCMCSHPRGSLYGAANDSGWAQGGGKRCIWSLQAVEGSSYTTETGKNSQSFLDGIAQKKRKIFSTMKWSARIVSGNDNAAVVKGSSAVSMYFWWINSRKRTYSLSSTDFTESPFLMISWDANVTVPMHSYSYLHILSYQNTHSVYFSSCSTLSEPTQRS